MPLYRNVAKRAARTIHCWASNDCKQFAMTRVATSEHVQQLKATCTTSSCLAERTNKASCQALLGFCTTSKLASTESTNHTQCLVQCPNCSSLCNHLGISSQALSGCGRGGTRVGGWCSYWCLVRPSWTSRPIPWMHSRVPETPAPNPSPSGAHWQVVAASDARDSGTGQFTPSWSLQVT